MKKIFIFLLLFTSIQILSNEREYLKSTQDRNNLRISICSGVSIQQIKNPELYNQLKYLSEEKASNRIYLTSEGYFFFEISRRLWNIFYTGCESGIIFSNTFFDNYNYEMVAIPITSVTGVQLTTIHFAIHAGVQVCYTNDILVGKEMSYPLDIGIRFAYRGLEVKLSNIITDKSSFRRGAVLSLGYNLLLR